MVLANQHARVERESAANAVVDGGFGYGQVIGREAMALGDRQGEARRTVRDRHSQRRSPRPHRRLGRAGRGRRARVDAFREHAGLRHPRGAARRQGPATVRQSRLRRARRADAPIILDISTSRDRRRQDPGRDAIEARRFRQAARSTATGDRTRSLRRSTVRRRARCCRSAGTRATGSRRVLRDLRGRADRAD